MFKKFVFACSFFLCLLIQTTVFALENDSAVAQPSVDAPVITEVPVKGGAITFEAGTGSYKIGYRCLPELILKLSESKKGLIEEGSALYFKTDAAYIISDVGANNPDYPSVSLQQDYSSESHIKRLGINILSSSKAPLTMELSMSPYVKAQYNIDGYHSIWLVTGPEYEDNVFSGLETGTILLSDHFLYIDSGAQRVSVEAPPAFRPLSITAGESKLVVQNEEIPLPGPAYLNQDGRLMVPIRPVLESQPDLYSITENAAGLFRFTHKYNKRLVALQADSLEISINDTKMPLQTAPILENGVFYMSIRDLAFAMGVNNSTIVWDPETKTVSLGGDSKNK